MLLTALCTGLVIVCALLTYSAHQAQRGAQRHADRLRGCVSRLTGLEGATDSLTTQLQKLRGTFYAFKAEHEPVAKRDTTLGAVARDEIDPPGAPPFCEKYGLAQKQGPLSEAAGCECAYCVEMRARRNAFRAQHFPDRVVGADNGG